MTEDKSDRTFGNKLYDRAKTLALVVLPALGTLYFLLAQIWDLPNVEKVMGSIVAIDAFLGGTLKFSSNRYYKNEKNFDGDINIIPEEGGGQRAQFAFNKDPRDVVEDEPGKHSFEFRVNKLKGGSDEH